MHFITVQILVKKNVKDRVLNYDRPVIDSLGEKGMNYLPAKGDDLIIGKDHYTVIEICHNAEVITEGANEYWQLKPKIILEKKSLELNFN